MSLIKVLPVVLLTGAGFTKNFGGYLARDMLTKIRNHGSESLKRWIDKRTPSDFEASYDEALKSGDDTLVRDMNDAVRDSFQDMDAEIRDRIKNGPYDSTIRNPPSVFGGFISKFAGDQSQSRSFWFTLNQDLFVERAWNSGSRQINIRIPGLENGYWFRPQVREYDIFSDELRERLPENRVEEFEFAGRKNPFDGVFNFIYIKLHGSVNWQSHDGGDCLVIGTRKSEQIKKEPILGQYFDVFEKVLCRPDCRLLVIGYGFGDVHINEVICKAIVDFRIKVFVSNCMLYEELRRVLKDALLPDDTKVNLGSRSAGDVILPATSVETQTVTELYQDQHGITNAGSQLLRTLGVLNY